MGRSRLCGTVLIVALSVSLVGSLSVRRARAATFTVINTNDSGTGSLRQAIMNANSLVGQDTINFNIPGGLFDIPTITPLSPLPDITDSVVLDGTGQGIFGLVELAGQNAGASANGLLIQTSVGCTVKGLVINRFGDAGIRLVIGGNHIVQGCYIGTDPSGTTALPNGRGIFVNASSNNLIGGTTAAGATSFRATSLTALRFSAITILSRATTSART